MICYYEGQVQNTKCIYSLQIKPLTRQGIGMHNEDKINKGNNKITELRTILQRESPNS